MALKTLLVPGLLLGAAHAPALAQEAAQPLPPEAAAARPDDADTVEDEEEGEEIVVTGARERGAVIGDIKPEVQLDRRDIRAYGAGSVAELLTALEPQTRGTRGRDGGRPVVLLNGRRISGFSEIRDIPPEAIERVDILPEEAALKYGYRTDQRLVNFVLRRRFRAVTGEVEGGIATDGGRASYGAELSTLRIDRGGRLNLAGEYKHAAPLFESERDIAQADPASLFDLGRFRTLLPETDQISLNGTMNRTVFSDVSATLNASFDENRGIGFIGAPAGTDRRLSRESDNASGHLGLALNGDILPWRWSFTGNYDRARSETFTQTATGSNIARSWTSAGTAELVLNGSLFKLPAGDVSTSVRAGFDARSLESEARRAGAVQTRDLSRQRGHGQLNIDLPIASRRREVLTALGNLSANFNAEVEHLSDFGTLRTIGYGLNWSPVAQISVIASVTDEDGAPSMQQLGDPLVPTPNVRVFDFTRGETVDITRLDGGNPGLSADNRRVSKLGLNFRPSGDTDISLSANYTRSRIRNPISSFPTATPEIEAAFPDRFTRDAGGRLVQIDARPVNFARADRDDLRWGINFSKPIKSARPPREAFPNRWRGQGQGQRQGAGEGRGNWQGRRQSETAPPAEGAPPAAGAAAAPAQGSPPVSGERARGGRGPGGPGGWSGGPGGGGFRGGGGGFGRGGAGQGGRLQLSLYHTWHLKDEILIREGVPVLDLLNGSALGSRGGRPEHEVEFQAGLFKNGMGARLTANWQSATFVRGGPTVTGAARSDLFFSDLATANLRLFADLGQQPGLVTKHPWLRGTRVTLSVDNILNSRPSVRDATGATPLSYQPAYLDPLGRSVRISIRKLFF